MRWVVLLCLFLSTFVDGYRILGLFPYAGKSHYDVFHPIIEELVSRGHEVTILTHFPPEKVKPGFSYVSLESASSKTKDVVDLSTIPNLRIVKYGTPFVLSTIGWETCKNLKHPSVGKLLGSDAKFDLVLVEQFASDCFLALAHHYRAPIIGLTSHILMPWTNARIGNIDNPAYIPNHFMDFSDRMGFLERVENTVAYTLCAIINHLFIQIPSNRRAREVFGDDVPSSAEIAANISLILANTHFTLNRPRPLPPSYVDVGGVHIGPIRQLPKSVEMRRVLLFLFLTALVDSYRILCLFPYIGKSHFIVIKPTLEALALKGHEVHVVSHFPAIKPIQTYHDIPLEDGFNSTSHTIALDVEFNTRLIKYLRPIEFGRRALKTCSHLDNPQLRKLAKSKFDVVLIELFNTDCYLGLIYQLNAPFIGVAAQVLMPFTNKLVGNIDNPSYIPNHFMHFSDEMSFLERLENTFVYLISYALHYLYMELPDNKIMQKHFGSETPYVGDIAKNISLILVNSHFTLNLPRPLVPGIIEIGGMHLVPQKPLCTVRIHCYYIALNI